MNLANKVDAARHAVAARSESRSHDRSVRSLVDVVLTWQRTVGNRATAAGIARWRDEPAGTEAARNETQGTNGPLRARQPSTAGMGPKLAVTAPGDPAEREADRIADRITRMPDEQARAAGLRPTPENTPSAALMPDVMPLDGGRPLQPWVRAFFEPRLGSDLSDVRLHTDALADLSVQSLGALAFTFGRHIAFRAGQYAPGSANGRWLLAHELAHVAANRRTGAVICRQVAADPTRQSITPTTASRMRDDELERQVNLLRQILQHATEGTPDYEGAAGNLAVLENEAQRRSGPGGGTPAAAAPGPAVATAKQAGLVQVPADLDYELVAGPGVDLQAQASGQFGLSAAAVRSTALGGARGIGYLISPPIRGALDPFLPLSVRLRPELGPLGAQPGGMFTAERYLTSPLRDLRPRYATEFTELFLQQGLGRSEWLRLYGITEKQLSEMPGLIGRMYEGGMGALAPAEQELVRTFFRAHAENLLTFASPGMSATTRSGLSSLEGVAPFLREAPYVVRVRVPANAVGEVNAVLGTARRANLVQELEVLIFTDARGMVTSIRPNPASALGKSTSGLRWVGRGFIVVGIGVSAYRIGTATSAELPRVVGEESGGWVFGLGGASLATSGCIILGIATEGVGLVLCGLVGGVGGGIGGSYVGGEIGQSLGRLRNMTPAQYNEAAVQMFGTPEQKRAYYQLQEIETGEPNPFSLF